MTQDRRAFLEKLASGGFGLLAGGLILRPRAASADPTPEEIQAMFDAYNAMMAWGVNQNDPPTSAWVVAAVQAYGVTSDVNDIDPNQSYENVTWVQDLREGTSVQFIPDCEMLVQRRMNIDRLSSALNLIAAMYATGASLTWVNPAVAATLGTAAGLFWGFSGLLSMWSSDLSRQPCV